MDLCNGADNYQDAAAIDLGMRSFRRRLFLRRANVKSNSFQAMTAGSPGMARALQVGQSVTA